MYLRILDLLRCPVCRGALEPEPLTRSALDGQSEVCDGLLHCEQDHWFPVVRGIPRMLSDSLLHYWRDIEPLLTASLRGAVRPVVDRLADAAGSRAYDWRTSDSFSSEWKYYELGDRTWGIDLDVRVKTFFLDALRIPQEELRGRVVLDAGCGNGTQSVAYTEWGVEVIAVDLSSGLERGQAFRHLRPGAKPDRVHFLQADLRAMPLDTATVDIIHSSGVLHHTPDTHATFDLLCPLLRPGGTFYVWLYSYEPVVTPLVNSIRAVTSRMSARRFDALARRSARAFQIFCRTVNRLGIRAYPDWSEREAALALTDIFGAPNAHWHTYEEVAGWYRSAGFVDVWPVNESRRGFGVCGRLPVADRLPVDVPV